MTKDEQITALVNRLEAYGRHYDWCQVKANSVCNCGFNPVLEQVRQWRERANERIAAEVAHHAMTGE
jgi:hypothetical protein